MDEVAATANRVLDSCGSTNDLARALGEAGYPHGTWVSARRQLGGRGRLGRKWESLGGNLFLSLVVRAEPQSLWTWIPLASAIGIARALRDPAALGKEIPVEVKWPNDLWLEKRKLGGILCEAVGTRSDSFIIVGIGLNCADHPEGIDQPATSLSRWSGAGAAVDADDIRLPVVAAVAGAVEQLTELGPAPIARDYEKWAALPPGSAIEWAGGNAGSILGLGSSGELRVRHGDGRELSLFAEDVSRVRAT
jgi:BirA family transcriptional regulator, biotin operon repressor / biotin---[acetyl-CoA-carboxylase] ligase